jgi:hypothetical protein
MLDSRRVEMDAIRAGAPRSRRSLPGGAVFRRLLGPCGPSSISGLIGLLGMLICFPFAGLILLGCGLGALLQGLRGGPEGLA